MLCAIRTHPLFVPFNRAGELLFEDSGAIRGVNFPWKCSQGCAQLCKQGLGRQLTFLGNAVRGATGAQGTAWSLGMQPSVRSCDFCL